MTLLPQTNGQFQFQFNAEFNRNYTAEYYGDLSATNCIVLTNITCLPAPADVIVSDAPLTDSNRFYCVRTPDNPSKTGFAVGDEVKSLNFLRFPWDQSEISFVIA